MNSARDGRVGRQISLLGNVKNRECDAISKVTQLEKLASGLSHSEKGRKPKRESALDRCNPVDECARADKDLVQAVADAAEEQNKKNAKFIELERSIINSDDYYNALMLTAPDEDTAQAIIKNGNTRLNEMPNFASYQQKVANKFAHARTTGDE